jgi:hypothetical protein
MAELYDIFYAGKIADGFDEATVRANIEKLFKANPQTLEKLFSGKPQVIKRGADKPAAIKYKSAMEKAGAVPLIRKQADGKTNTATARPEKKPEKKQTLAERLAALTGEPAPDPGTDSRQPDPPASPIKQDEEGSTGASVAAAAAGAAAGPAAAGFDSSLSLAPAGSDVLRDDERQPLEELDIDTSAIQLAPEFAETPLEPQPEVHAPDISHLTMGDVGDDIPVLPNEAEPVDPDTSHLSLGEVGEDIPLLEVERELIDPDTSGIELAPEGSDLLDAKHRKREDARAPDTSHISLED